MNIVGYPLWQHYFMKYDVTRANNRYLVNVNCNSATHKNSKLKSCTAHDCRLLRITWYFSFVKMRINAQNTVYHFYSEMDFILWDNKTKGCNEVCLIFFFFYSWKWFPIIFACQLQFEEMDDENDNNLETVVAFLAHFIYSQSRTDSLLFLFLSRFVLSSIMHANMFALGQFYI